MPALAREETSDVHAEGLWKWISMFDFQSAGGVDNNSKGCNEL